MKGPDPDCMCVKCQSIRVIDQQPAEDWGLTATLAADALAYAINKVEVKDRATCLSMMLMYVTRHVEGLTKAVNVEVREDKTETRH